MMRAVFAAFLLLCVGDAALAQAPNDPVAYVRAIYRHYEQDKFASSDKLNYSPAMRKLIQADRKKSKGEVGALDFDPIVNGQDQELSDVRVELASRQGDTAAVDVHFRNFGSEHQTRFNLLRIGGKWAIDDIAALDKPRWTMSKILVGAPDAFEKE